MGSTVKEIAFRGYRRRILDDIAGAQFLVKQLDYKTSLAKVDAPLGAADGGGKLEKPRPPKVSVPEDVFIIPWLKQQLQLKWAGHPNTRIRAYLIALERSFATEVQKVLDPARWAQEFHQLLAEPAQDEPKAG
jgi:hypothetical protein